MMRLTLVMGIASASSSPLDSNDSMPPFTGRVLSHDSTPAPTTPRPTWSTAPTISPAPTVTPAPTATPLVADDSTIRTAVQAWGWNQEAAEAKYGHISTWDTSRVRDMGHLFSRDYFWGWSFNEDISAWDTSSATTFTYMFFKLESFNQPISGWNVDKVTSMTDMFRGAKAFDQDLGWCLSGDVKMTAAFEKTKCESTRCGFSYKDVIGNCERLSPPCLIYAARPWSARKGCRINSPTLAFLLANILLVLIASAEWYVHRRKGEDETYVVAARRLLCCRRCQSKMESSSVTSPRPDSPAESPRDEPDEEATTSESLESRAQAAAKAEESVEPSSFSKLTSFLFGEREEAPTEEAPKEEEEAAALPVFAEAEEEATEQPPPPPPARRWFSREEPEPAPPKAEATYSRVKDWYNEPENAALRATWGTFPEHDEFQTWPGFVAVTNAFLDASTSEPEA
jgi:surface protein